MDLQRLVGIANDVMIARYTMVATLGLITYEYIVTFDDEKRLIWPSRFSLVKSLFLTNRYLPFVTVLMGLNYIVLADDDSVCKWGFFVTGMFSCLQYIVSEAVLFTRCYALWGRNRVILSLLCSVFVVGTAFAFYVTYLFLNGISVSPVRFFARGCLLSFANRIDWISLVILMFCETLSLSLLLIKAFLQFRHTRSPLLETMLNDGILYYITVLMTTTANLCVLLLARPTLCNFMLIVQGTMHNVLCTRLLLRLRGAYEMLCEKSYVSIRVPMSSVVRA